MQAKQSQEPHTLIKKISDLTVLRLAGNRSLENETSITLLFEKNYFCIGGIYGVSDSREGRCVREE